jgi:hypothetical protein
MPYESRRMSPEQREIVLRLRESKGYPLHAPPHPLNEKTYTTNCMARLRGNGIWKMM